MVLAVGDTVVRNCREFAEAAGRLKPGESVVLLIKRGRTILSVTVATACPPAGGAGQAAPATSRQEKQP